MFENLKHRLSLSKTRETVSRREEIEMTEISAVTEVKLNIIVKNSLNSHKIEQKLDQEDQEEDIFL